MQVETDSWKMEINIYYVNPLLNSADGYEL